MNPDPDAELVLGCQRKDPTKLEGEFRLLYDRYKDRIYNVCYRITGNATDGTVSIETLIGGLPANNDAFTINSGARGNAVVDGTFSIDSTTDYTLTADAIAAGTDATAIALDWTTTPTHTGYYTSGIPPESAAGGGGAPNLLRGLAR